MSDPEKANVPLEYWVTVLENYIEMGGHDRESAEAYGRMLASEGEKVIAQRLLRYIPGKGLVDITPKGKRKNNMSPENRAKAAERMRRYWEQRNAANGGGEC